MTHPDMSASDRELLERLLAGELVETAPEVAEHLRRRPWLMAELRAMRQLVANLDVSGAEMAREIEVARSQVAASDIAAARRAIAEHLPVRRIVRLRWVAAAAALLVTLLIAVWRGARGVEVDPILGPPRESIGAEPQRDWQGPLREFRWDAEPPPAGHMAIAVYVARDGLRTNDLLLENADLDGNAWPLRADEQNKLAGHQELCWELTPIDANGQAKAPWVFFVRLHPSLGPRQPSIHTEPQGDCEGPLREFRWDAEPPPAGHMAIAVYAARDGLRTNDLLLENPDLDGRSWQLSVDEQNKLAGHQELCWELMPIDANGHAQVPWVFFVRLRR